MSFQMRLGYCFALLATLWGCHPRDSSIQLPDSSGLIRIDRSDLVKAVRAAQVVFIGELVHIDPGWSSYAGAIAPFSKSAKFRVVSVLKGDYSPRSMVVQYFMFGGNPWVEEDPAKGIRLSPAFFREGRKYFVMVSYLEKDFPPGFYDVGHEPYGCMQATVEGLGAVCSSVREVTGRVPSACAVPQTSER